MIVPVYKMGTGSDPTNCRPFVQTPIISRITEILIKYSLMAYPLEQELINTG